LRVSPGFPKLSGQHIIWWEPSLAKEPSARQSSLILKAKGVWEEMIEKARA
jgi:hypothetical protein